MQTRILIADDHAIFRNGLALLIGTLPDVQVVGQACNGEELLALLKQTHADLVTVDMQMPKIDGVRAAQKIKKEYPKTKVIVISSFDDLTYVETMIEHGVDGYLTKDLPMEEMKSAFKKVIAGGNYFADAILLKLVARMGERKQATDVTAKISDREREVLELICKGWSRTEIAEKLFISEKTADKHKENLIKKTGTKNAVDLALFAYRTHLVPID